MYPLRDCERSRVRFPVYPFFLASCCSIPLILKTLLILGGCQASRGPLEGRCSHMWQPPSICTFCGPTEKERLTPCKSSAGTGACRRTLSGGPRRTGHRTLCCRRPQKLAPSMVPALSGSCRFHTTYMSSPTIHLNHLAKNATVGGPRPTVPPEVLSLHHVLPQYQQTPVAEELQLGGVTTVPTQESIMCCERRPP